MSKTPPIMYQANTIGWVNWFRKVINNSNKQIKTIFKRVMIIVCCWVNMKVRLLRGNNRRIIKEIMTGNRYYKGCWGIGNIIIKHKNKTRIPPSSSLLLLTNLWEITIITTMLIQTTTNTITTHNIINNNNNNLLWINTIKTTILRTINRINRVSIIVSFLNSLLFKAIVKIIFCFLKMIINCANSINRTTIMIW